jgi:hypothetical protein
VDRERIRAFVAGRERFADGLAGVAGRMDGTPEVLRVIERRLRRDATPATAAALTTGPARSPG